MMMTTTTHGLEIVGTKRRHGQTVLTVKDSNGDHYEVFKRDLANAIHDFASYCGAEERTTRRDRYGLPVYQGLMDKIDWRVACVETDVLLGCDVYDDED